MKKYIFLLFAAVLVTACSIDRAEEIPGPQGIQGEQGPKGERGQDGQDGNDGEDGTRVYVYAFESSDKCPAGGIVISTYSADGTLLQYQQVCNGTNGQDGADGADGQDGQDGADGQDGQDGADGQDGTCECESTPEDCDENDTGDKIALCHKQEKDKNNGNGNGPDDDYITIWVNQNAVQAHLNHGDTVGECD